jgi:alpha-galactosidase
VKFPNGLGPIVEKIHQKGMLAGIWLAPFAAERRSDLVQKHPDWVHDRLAGSNWGGFYPLNLDVPETVDYVRKVLRHYVELGFDFFKLDFLYAASLVPMRGKTRCETATYAYTLLRECLGEDKLILGCGATLANAFEIMDYMRIGPDVSLKFDDVFYMRLFHPERISTKVTLMNTIYRSPMNGHVFLNDPDVFLLRDQNIQLSKGQRQALARINALFGSLLMTSDRPQDYDEETKALLDDTLRLFRSEAMPAAARFRRLGRMIQIRYQQEGLEHRFWYDTKKGVIRDER